MSISRLDPSAPTEPQIVFIQYLGGVAPLLVLWAHLSGFWLYAHGRGWTVETDWFVYVSRPLGLYENGGHLGVVLFFFVSGYIITYTSRRESQRSFAIKRAFRLLPALWVAVAVVALARLVARLAGVGAPTGTTGREGWWLCALTVAVFVAVYQVLAPGVLQASDGPANTYVLGLLLFLVLMYAAPKRAPWAIRRLADISYSLYLLHIPVGMLTIALVIKTGAPFTVAFIAGVATSITAAAISYRYVEAPSQLAGRRLIRASHAIASPRTATDRSDHHKTRI